MLQKSTRNCQFYSHYIRPARFSTHETREGLIELNVLNTLFYLLRIVITIFTNIAELKLDRICYENQREIINFILMRHAKDWIETNVLRSPF